MTPLILIGYALEWAMADATADLPLHERAAADDCRGYGVKGKVYEVIGRYHKNIL